MMRFERFLSILPLAFVCLLVAAPILALLQSWLFVDGDIWRHLAQTQLAELLKNTFILVFGVGLGVSILGVSLAWLTAVCEFPGRRLFDWALILPLAIPAYVLAFVTLGIFDFGGAVQSGLQALGYKGYFDARHPLMVVWVMTAVLYPYVYLLVRVSFLAQGNSLLNMARTLGRSPIKAFLTAVLPAARPAIIAGVSLALMEALADFGAVSIFGFNTFTTAIYKSWLSLFSLETAAQLSTLLLLFVMLCLYGEKASRKGLLQNPKAISRNKDRIILGRKSRWLASGFCFFVLFTTVIAPMLQLVFWSQSQWLMFLNADLFSLIFKTFMLGFMASLFVLVLALAVSMTGSVFQSGTRKVVQQKRIHGFFREMATSGYALPGSVLAIGVMFCLSRLDLAYVSIGHFFGLTLSPIFLGSLAGLLIAYVIRYFRPGFGAVQAGFDEVHNNHIESARLMGLSRIECHKRITLPLVLPGLLTGGLIVFVDVIKEMPATLLLRPFGWDTLAVKLYELTSEGHWERAAVPAILLVLVSTVPVILLIFRSRTTVKSDSTASTH